MKKETYDPVLRRERFVFFTSQYKLSLWTREVSSPK